MRAFSLLCSMFIWLSTASDSFLIKIFDREDWSEPVEAFRFLIPSDRKVDADARHLLTTWEERSFNANVQRELESFAN
jgi:hypothetical protein